MRKFTCLKRRRPKGIKMKEISIKLIPPLKGMQTDLFKNWEVEYASLDDKNSAYSFCHFSFKTRKEARKMIKWLRKNKI